MKLFEEREYSDGGPNDRGVVIGYHEANSAEELKKKFSINHGFIQFHKVSKEYYMQKKLAIKEELKIYSYEY